MFSFRSSKHVSFSFLKTCFLFGPQNMFSFSVLKTCFPFRSSKHVSFSFLKTGFLFGPQNRFPFRSSKQVSFSFLKTGFLLVLQNRFPFRSSKQISSFVKLQRCDSGRDAQFGVLVHFVEQGCAHPHLVEQRGVFYVTHARVRRGE